MQRKSYKTDLTDSQWQLIAPLIPTPKKGGRPRTVNMREVLNGIFYVIRTGSQWGMLPDDFPACSTVYHYFRRFVKQRVWQKMNNILREQIRIQNGRESQATAAIVDSQSVKTTEKRGEVYGFDGGKLIKGRKRHIVVDTQGLLLSVVVTDSAACRDSGIANGNDRVGAAAALMEDTYDTSSLNLVWGDQGYSGQRFEKAVVEICGARVEVVKRTDKEFVILPRRWVVERTFGWLGRDCFVPRNRLSKDYELLPEVSEAIVYTAMVRLMLNRLAS